MSNSILKIDMYNILTSCIYGVLGGGQVVTPKEMGGKGLHELEIKRSQCLHPLPPICAMNLGLGSALPATLPCESWSRGAPQKPGRHPPAGFDHLQPPGSVPAGATLFGR